MAYIAGVFVLGFSLVASTVIANSAFFIALLNAMPPETKRVLSDRKAKTDRACESEK